MVVVPEGDGTGLFEVWTGDCDEDDGQPYVVDLGGEHDRCSCPDQEYNLSDGERCKHSRRVRLEFALPPFGDVPAIRSEHAAPMDVELCRRRRGIDVEPESAEPEIVIDESEPLEVQAAQTVEAIADGGTVVATDGGRVVESGPERTAHTQGSEAQDTAEHAEGCDNPECEGFDADGRPLLSFECWEVWS